LAFLYYVEGAAIFLFCVAKAKMASRGREKFLSGNLFVTTIVEGTTIFF